MNRTSTMLAAMAGAAMIGGAATAGIEELAGNLGGPLTDDASVERSLGFDFNFYGVDYGSVFIGSNGILSFGDAETDFSPSLPEFESDPSGPAVAGLWTDLSPNISGSITLDTTVPGQATVNYVDVPRFGQPDALNTFSVTLFENGNITFEYGDLGYGTSTEETIVGLTDRSGAITTEVDWSSMMTWELPGAGTILGELYDNAGGNALDLANSTITFVPAPGALALLGLAGLAGSRRRRG